MRREEKSILTGLVCECRFIDNEDFFGYVYEDPICGTYLSEIAPYDEFTEEEKSELKKVAHVLGAKRLRSKKKDYQHNIVLTCSDEKEPLKGRYEHFECKSIDEILSEYPNPAEMLDELLINLSHMTDHPGDEIPIDFFSGDSSYSYKSLGAYLYAHDSGSVIYMLDQLENLGYVKVNNKEHSNITVQIEAAGWKRVQFLQMDTTQSDQCFVAMWFDSKMQLVWENGIKAALEDAGYKPVRIDEKETNNKICDEIIAEIRKSKFLVADFTGQRGGVYYEAGFAQGLGKPVIWLVHSDDIDNVHFDTRQYSHIVYGSAEELRNKLCKRVQAIIV